MPLRATIQRYVPLAATLLVVLGVVAIVRLDPSKAPEKAIPSGAGEASDQTQAFVTAFLAKDTMTFSDERGTTKSCLLPNGFSAVDAVVADGFQVRSATGARMLIGFDCSVKNPKLIPGFPNPSGTRAAQVMSKRRDGAGVVEVSDGKYAEEITLRGKNSRPYRDPEMVGWLNDNVFAVTAFQGDAKYVLTVQTTGRITELYKVPEASEDPVAGGGAVWYVTFTPGAGIEIGPSAPSELHRLTGDGATVVSKDDKAVMEGVLVSHGGAAVYRSGESLMLVREDGEIVNTGSGIPLGWSSEEDLLVDREGRIVVIATSGVRETDITVPDGARMAWRLRATLDAGGTSQ